MNLFYAPPEQVQGRTLTLAGDEARHASKVLRYQVGDAIFITDGVGNQYEGRVEVAGKNDLQVSILHKHFTPKPGELILVLGVLKNRQRLEFAIEKAVEIGSTKIILFKSDHSERSKVNVDRLQTIAGSAMKQSLRSYLPAIQYHHSLEDAIGDYKNMSLITAHEKQKNETLEIFKLDTDYLALVGPEGGFSEDEMQLMKDNKARIISLGDHRLRAETAVVALLSRFY
ncbi:MAG: RsmE family RNA methyltransferase [Balneolales bacterium]